MSTISEAPALPDEAREILDCIYKLHKISPGDAAAKIVVLRQQIIKDELFIASNGGVLDEKDELAVLEEYVLAMFDVI